jgi:hypothetical protein
MLFKCPCGFVNYVDALPANHRLTCEGCRKTWVVSKTTRKRRKYAQIVYLALAMACTLVPPTWPWSPILLVVLAARMLLLTQRYKWWARIALTALVPIIWALIAAIIFGIIALIGQSTAGNGHGGDISRFSDRCLVLSVLLQEWSGVGLGLFGLFVLAVCTNQYLGKPKFGNLWETGREIVVWSLAAIAALGLFMVMGAGSISNLAAGAEARLENRYLEALDHNDKARRSITLITSVQVALQAGLRPEDKEAFSKFLASESSAADAVNVAERYLRSAGLTSSGGSATSRPADDHGEQFELIWQARSLHVLRDEQRRTAEEEGSEAALDGQLSHAMSQLTQTASMAIGISPGEHAKAIGEFFGGIVDFMVNHFPANQLDARKGEIAAAICSAGAAHELNIRETVAKLYQQAVVAETLETWQPNSNAYPSSVQTKTITIKNTSSQILQFWAVGPDVREAYLPPGTKRDIALDKGTYQAVLSVDGGSPTVLDLGYGVGHLSGEFTTQKTWRQAADSDNGS